MKDCPAHTNPGSLPSVKSILVSINALSDMSFGDYAIKYLQSQIFGSGFELSIVDNLESILSLVY